MKVSVAEARAKLTELIKRVEAGERVTVCRHGVPVVEIVWTQGMQREGPKFGTGKGKKVILDPDWAAPQNDIEAWMQGDF